MLRRYLNLIAAVAAGLGVYGLLGGWLLPAWLQHVVLPDWATRHLLGVSVNSLTINPYTLNISVHEAWITPSDGQPWLGVHGAEVQVDASESLKKQTLVLEARVRGMTAHIDRQTGGLRGFSQLSGDSTPESSGPPSHIPVYLRQLLIEDSQLVYHDQTGHTPLHRTVKRWALRLEQEEGPAAIQARYEASLATDQDEQLQTHGHIQWYPLKLEGTLTVNHLHWPDWGTRYAGLSGLTWQGGTLNIEAGYRVNHATATALTLTLNGSAQQLAVVLNSGQNISLGQLGLNGLEYSFPENRLSLQQLGLTSITLTNADQPANSIESVRLSDIQYNLADNTLHLGRLETDHALLHTGIEASGRMNFSGWPDTPQKPPPPVTEPVTESSPTLNISLDDLKLDDYTVDFQDASRGVPVQLPLNTVSLRMQNLNTKATSPVQLDMTVDIGRKGRFRVSGQGQISPPSLEARLDMSEVNLKPFEAYWDEWTGFELVSGQVNLQGNLALKPDRNENTFSGDVEITHFKTMDKLEKKDFADWESLRLDGLVLDTQPQKASFKSIVFRKPQARIVVDKDGSINLARQLLKNTEKKTSASTPWPLVIGTLRIIDGGMNFSDMTLEPRFTSDIKALNGNIRGLSTRSRAEVLITGNLNERSPVRITGQFNPFETDNFTDVTMTFNNVNLTNLSPYSGKFAGYRIEKGKLDLDLHYQLAGRTLKAENRMRLNQLVLGERVDSPDATHLPVRWALALLEDSDGKIDISLPVRGRLDDPQFSIRNLLGVALTQTVTKLVSSPFSVLGKLTAWHNHEELAWIGFEAGDNQLSEPSRTKLNAVADILKQRPGINLDIKSQANWNQDRRVLAEQAFKEYLDNRYRMERKPRRPEDKPDESEYNRLVTVFFLENYPVSPETRSLADTPNAILDKTNLQKAIKRILDDWPVDEPDLRQLAMRRSESIRRYLAESSGIPDARIFLLDVQVGTADNPETQSFLSLSVLS
ncbi:MAG: DUF748 domain-containing protein [Methylococcaceae bacterium]